MNVFSELFNDLTGWLTVGIIVFMLVMMAFLFSMFINKSAGITINNYLLSVSLRLVFVAVPVDISTG